MPSSFLQKDSQLEIEVSNPVLPNLQMQHTPLEYPGVVKDPTILILAKIPNTIDFPRSLFFCTLVFLYSYIGLIQAV
jgi:hypothetical protein